MNRRTLLLCAALCALLVVPPSAGAATNPCREHAKKKRVVAQSRSAVAYYTGSAQAGTLNINACSFKGRKSMRLPGQDGRNTNYVSEVLLNGRYLAYSVYDTEEAGTLGFSYVYSIDLRTRKTLVEIDASSGHDDGGFGSKVSALVLGSKGAVAWINEVSGPERWSVHVAAGENHSVLDTGGDIDAQSLALAANKKTIYWTRAGLAKTAALP